MKIPAKKIAFAASVAFNALAALLFALAALSPAPIRFSLPLFSRRYLHSALIVSVPWDGDPGGVAFGPAEVSLKKGSLASLQLSIIRDIPGSKRPAQSNLAVDPLYDPSVVRVEPSGYGIFIHALSSGETALQVFSGGSFRDLAIVRVYDGGE